jgi:hypothetical protein
LQNRFPDFTGKRKAKDASGGTPDAIGGTNALLKMSKNKPFYQGGRAGAEMNNL